jgi:alkyl sulfatase BDS1-like metallo-beta-lactamase superfamily hydrolase
VLISIQRAADGTAAALTLTKARLLGLLAGDTASPGIGISGDPTTLQTLLGVLEAGDPSFNIVTP